MIEVVGKTLEDPHRDPMDESRHLDRKTLVIYSTHMDPNGWIVTSRSETLVIDSTHMNPNGWIVVSRLENIGDQFNTYGPQWTNRVIEIRKQWRSIRHIWTLMDES